MGCSQSRAVTVVERGTSARPLKPEDDAALAADPAALGTATAVASSAENDADSSPDARAISGREDGELVNDSMLSDALSQDDYCDSVPEFVEYPGAIASCSSDTSTKLPSTFTFSFIQVGGDEPWSQTSASSISQFVAPISEDVEEDRHSLLEMASSKQAMAEPGSITQQDVASASTEIASVPVPVATQVLGEESPASKVGVEEPTVVVACEEESVQVVEEAKLPDVDSPAAVAVSAEPAHVHEAETGVVDASAEETKVEPDQEDVATPLETEISLVDESTPTQGDADGTITVTTEVEVDVSATEEASLHSSAVVEKTTAEPDMEASASTATSDVYTITGHTTEDGVVVYQVAASDASNAPALHRRYSDFSRMYKKLKSAKLPHAKSLPSLPSAGVGSVLRGRHSQKLIDKRQEKFETILQYISEHRELSSSDIFQAFVSPSADLSASATQEVSATQEASATEEVSATEQVSAPEEVVAV